MNEIQNTPQIETIMDEVKSSEVGSEPSQDESVDAKTASFEPHAAIREKAERKRVRRRLFGVGMIWITTLAILALAALFAWLFRAQIVDRFPATQTLYAALGVKASKTGLEIYDIRTEYGEVDGTSVLFIKGEIKNYDRQDRDVPMVQINFKNDNNEVLTSWAIEPTKSILGRGETQSFSGEYPNPPIDATKLVPVFVDEAALLPNTPQQ